MKLILIWLGTFTLTGLSADFYCQTQYGEKTLLITDESIHLEIEKNKRQVASITRVASSLKDKALRKNFLKDGQQFVIVIGDVKNPRISHDFMSITNDRGHKITYPLNCELL